MPFDKETMLGVVKHYAARRMQNIDCPDCEFLPYDSLGPDEEIPEGFEALRNGMGLVKQCEEHDKSEFPFLREIPIGLAANFLVEKSKNGPFQVNFAEWESYCAAVKATLPETETHCLSANSIE